MVQYESSRNKVRKFIQNNIVSQLDTETRLNLQKSIDAISLQTDCSKKLAIEILNDFQSIGEIKIADGLIFRQEHEFEHEQDNLNKKIKEDRETWAQ